MAVTTTYPGVYIQELPSSTHNIVGVSTSITAFAGWANQGPVNEAVLIQNWTQFVTQFGGLNSNSYLGYAVQQYFQNGGQQAYIVRIADLTSGTPAKAALIVNNGLTYSAQNPGVWGDNYGIIITPSALAPTTRFTLQVGYLPSGASTPTIVESYNNLSYLSSDPQYVVNIVNQQSNYLVITGSPTSTTPAVQAYEALATGADGNLLSPSITTTPGTFETALLASGSGINLLSNVSIFNIVCVPGLYAPTTISSVQQFCLTNRAFMIVDSWVSDTVTSISTNTPTSAIVTAPQSANSALYFPWINYFDSVQNITRAFPPSGSVAGVYASTDSGRGVWKAPAGINAGFAGESGLATVLTDAQNGTLNPLGINCLRNFPNSGDVVWGARTLNGNDQAGSQWKYVPVRRLSLYIEQSLIQGTKWVVFEPNDANLWSAIRLNVSSFMQGLYQQGAFQGTTPQQAYFVKCDSETTTQANINSGVVNIVVGFAPVQPAEFVIIQIQQIAGQNS